MTLGRARVVTAKIRRKRGLRYLGVKLARLDGGFDLGMRKQKVGRTISKFLDAR